MRAVAAFETDRELGKIGSPVDRDEWFMLPQHVNAYYNPGMNEICFPAGILQPPFFDADADPAENYGGIGAVIGHEIGHGFDDQGSQYDELGNMENWWTADDRDAFQERADKLIEQYDGFEPTELPGEHVNGALTVGENIGDLGGITIALKAYLISLEGQDAPVVDGLTGVQRVFLNFANIWRAKRRKEQMLQLLTVDPHSPAEFRANIVRNLDEFHEAFDTAARRRPLARPRGPRPHLVTPAAGRGAERSGLDRAPDRRGHHGAGCGGFEVEVASRLDQRARSVHQRRRVRRSGRARQRACGAAAGTPAPGRGRPGPCATRNDVAEGVGHVRETPAATSAGRPARRSRVAHERERAGERRWTLKPLVSSTENSAVPIEAAICWVMFISVEPRAISWSFSVCSAEVMIGIIVPPMPRPMTNSAPAGRGTTGR